MPVTALRARALCSGCESRLPPRTDAWWDEETRTATCLSCARALGLLEVAAIPIATGATPPPADAPSPAAEAAPTAADPTAADPAPGDLDVIDRPEAPAAAEPDEDEPAADPPAAVTPAADDLPHRAVVRPFRAEPRTPQAAPGTIIRRRAAEPAAEPVEGEDVEGEDAETGAAAAAVRPPLPPREQVTALRPSRKPTTEVAAARRFPSEGATAIEAESDPSEDAADDGTPTPPPTPPLRRAEALPPDEDAGDDEAGEDGAERDPEEDKDPGPPHVQSAADLIGRLRAVQRPSVRPAPRRGPLVVERPDLVADRGQIDDTRVTQTLEAARIHGVEVLHHRPVTADREVDHLVIAVNGIWTVVEEEKLTGPLEKRDLGDWFTADARLFIGEDDRTDLIETARSQAEAVRVVLADGPFATVPVRPVVCFGTVPPGWVREPFVLGGVSVTWRNHLVEPMLDPVLLDREARHQLIELLVADGR